MSRAEFVPIGLPDNVGHEQARGGVGGAGAPDARGGAVVVVNVGSASLWSVLCEFVCVRCASSIRQS